jgi:dCTP deaminase
LDNKIRFFVVENKKISINDGLDYMSITKEIDITGGYLLRPGELVIGMTKEKVTLPDNLCAWLNSRSRFARVGFMSHITAPFLNPGISNRSALEIYNAGNEIIELLPGVKVCQMILEEVKGGEKYEGIYKDQ